MKFPPLVAGYEYLSANTFFISGWLHSRPLIIEQHYPFMSERGEIAFLKLLTARYERGEKIFNYSVICAFSPYIVQNIVKKYLKLNQQVIGLGSIASYEDEDKKTESFAVCSNMFFGGVPSPAIGNKNKLNNSSKALPNDLELLNQELKKPSSNYESPRPNEEPTRTLDPF